jgi:aminoglycoside phosphotransferase (APT) family kinase protein/SAM-dependent methyltransferase
VIPDRVSDEDPALLPAERASLTRAVEQRGWPGGLQLFLDGLPARRAFLLGRRLAFHVPGWRFLLPGLRKRRALCFATVFDNTPLTFASLADECVVVAVDPLMADGLRHRLSEAGHAQVKVITADPETSRLPFAGGHFDAIVADDIEAVIRSPSLPSRPQRSAALAALFREVGRVLSADGVAFFGLRRGGPSSLFDWLPHRGNSAPLGVGHCQRAARQAGLRLAAVHPFIIDRGLLSEVILGRYRSLRLGKPRKERLKELVLRGPFAAPLAHGIGIVCDRGHRTGSFVREMIQILEGKGILSAGSWEPKRYLVLNGKVIISIGLRPRRNGELIVVLPLTPGNVARRRHEHAILRRLASSGTAMSSLVPTALGESSLHGQPYFALTEMTGVSIDAAPSNLQELTERASETLSRFHASTIRDARLEGDLRATLLTEPLSLMRDQLGDTAAPAVNQISDALCRQFAVTRTRTVWTHGDFKIENVLFEQGTSTVTGIIDWDLSQEQGWPLLDLLYLIAYNRVLREGRAFEDVVQNTLVPWRLTSEEHRLITAYQETVGLAAENPAVAVALFWVQHLGTRFQIDRRIPGLVERLSSVTTSVAAKLVVSEETR